MLAEQTPACCATPRDPPPKGPHDNISRRAPSPPEMQTIEKPFHRRGPKVDMRAPGLRPQRTGGSVDGARWLPVAEEEVTPSIVLVNHCLVSVSLSAIIRVSRGHKRVLTYQARRPPLTSTNRLAHPRGQTSSPDRATVGNILARDGLLLISRAHPSSCRRSRPCRTSRASCRGRTTAGTWSACASRSSRTGLP